MSLLSSWWEKRYNTIHCYAISDWLLYKWSTLNAQQDIMSHGPSMLHMRLYYCSSLSVPIQPRSEISPREQRLLKMNAVPRLSLLIPVTPLELPQQYFKEINGPLHFLWKDKKAWICHKKLAMLRNKGVDVASPMCIFNISLAVADTHYHGHMKNKRTYSWEWLIADESWKQSIKYL